VQFERRTEASAQARLSSYEGQVKDIEFSRRIMEEHWRAGYDDATVTLSHPEVLTLSTTEQGVAIYDFLTPVAHPRAVKSHERMKK
jgi:NTE family protein